MTASTVRTKSSKTSAYHLGGGGPRPCVTAPLLPFRELTTTVPKELVHRAAVAEVMLTNWRATGEDTFTVTAQWPRGHSFFGPVGGRHDSLIVAETVRQAAPLLAHAEYGVPLGHHFLMWDLRFTTEPEHLAVGGAPTALVLHIACFDIKRRGKSVSGMRYTAEVRREDGALVATGGARWACVAPQVHKRVRAGYPLGPTVPLTAPVPPQSVGRTSPTDVVLSPLGRDESGWLLRVDTRHPVLFDHPVDHVPGMVLLEAARQATADTLGLQTFLPASMDSTYHRYVELDAPCRIEASRLPDAEDGSARVHVTAHQSGQIAFDCIVGAPVT